ncbi:MAG: F0F1 ATP synthase subunit C [Alphaproteobacteria bacterium]|nr:F0F1 ATP synthase subunit C [Alphaproteobacteria bacterium]MCB9791117.1 F0F1 ATP synthase subunit C [Alphaproteobacteria bacterium]
MTPQDWIAIVSIVTAGFAVAIGTIAPAIGEARALTQAMDAIARQPDAANAISRTLFVGMAMVESTAIYALVIALVLLFANPMLG